MVIDKYVFPVIFRCLIDFMHDAEVRVRFRNLVPPLPRLTVERAIRIRVHVFQSSKVGRNHHLVCS